MDSFDHQTCPSYAERNSCVKFEGNLSNIATTRSQTNIKMCSGVGARFMVPGLELTLIVTWIAHFPIEIRSINSPPIITPSVRSLR